jgi:hypothetical protein
MRRHSWNSLSWSSRVLPASPDNSELKRIAKAPADTAADSDQSGEIDAFSGLAQASLHPDHDAVG